MRNITAQTPTNVESENEYLDNWFWAWCMAQQKAANHGLATEWRPAFITDSRRQLEPSFEQACNDGFVSANSHYSDSYAYSDLTLQYYILTRLME